MKFCLIFKFFEHHAFSKGYLLGEGFDKKTCLNKQILADV